MNKQSLLAIQKSTRQLISSFHAFMSECNVKAGRGIIGELLVFERIISQHGKSLSMGGNFIKFRGSSVKGHDIEMRLDDRFFKINAKGTTERLVWSCPVSKDGSSMEY